MNVTQESQPPQWLQWLWCNIQDIPYYRYMKEIEWQTMSHTEVIKDIKKGANDIKGELPKLHLQVSYIEAIKISFPLKYSSLPGLFALIKLLL